MARRHSRKGCNCTTCTNERIYDRTPAVRERWAAWWDSLDEISYARHRATKRAWQRRRQEAKDISRLEDLHRRAAT